MKLNNLLCIRCKCADYYFNSDVITFFFCMIGMCLMDYFIIIFDFYGKGESFVVLNLSQRLTKLN